MKHWLKVAVPPGVGDIYWCLTKLTALRDKYEARRVQLLIQKAGPPRALGWYRMVDFVNSTAFHRFKPTPLMRTNGIDVIPGADFGLWPNAIVDQGLPLADWLPDLALDMDFKINTKDFDDKPPRVLVYASSLRINQAWLPNLRAAYWVDLICELTERVGDVTLIGAGWDDEFTQILLSRKYAAKVSFENLTGKTTLPEVAGLIENARLLVGVISGMTILANHFRTPTIAFYPNAHHPKFPWTWVAPNAPYMALRSQDIPSAGEVAAFGTELARPVVSEKMEA